MTDPPTLDSRLRDAAGAVARARLADAFGHVSARTDSGIAVTPAVPLAEAAVSGVAIGVPFGAERLPEGAPREAWLPLAIAEAEPRAGAIVRAQPRAVAAVASLGRELPVLNGHAAMLGRVHVHPHSVPARERADAEAVVAASAGAECLILRGNGAVVWAADLASAVARMWVLEATAALALRAWAAGEPIALPAAEVAWWRKHAAELLPRIYRYLSLAQTDTETEGVHS